MQDITSCSSINNSSKCRGKGDYHRLGHGSYEHVRRPMRVTGMQGKMIVSIATGMYITNLRRCLKSRNTSLDGKSAHETSGIASLYADGQPLPGKSPEHGL